MILYYITGSELKNAELVDLYLNSRTNVVSLMANFKAIRILLVLGLYAFTLPLFGS